MPPLKVMLVDDDDDLRLVGKIALADVAGWPTVVASSGLEAVSLARTQRFDAILLDFVMPDVDGIATLRLLREHDASRDVPVIFLTARSHREDIERFLAMGAIGVIGKPFDPLSLADEVRRIVMAATASTGVP